MASLARRRHGTNSRHKRKPAHGSKAARPARSAVTWPPATWCSDGGTHVPAHLTMLALNSPSASSRGLGSDWLMDALVRSSRAQMSTPLAVSGGAMAGWPAGGAAALAAGALPARSPGNWPPRGCIIAQGRGGSPSLVLVCCRAEPCPKQATPVHPDPARVQPTGAVSPCFAPWRSGSSTS